MTTEFQQEPLVDVTEDFIGTITDEPIIPEPEPAPFEEATPLVGDGACIVCGAPTFRPPGLTPTGRKKRIPRYCDLHTPNARVSYEGPSDAGLESQLQKMQDELADDLRLLGTLAGPMFPVTGYYLFTNADPFTIAILKLVKGNQRLLRVLYRASQVAPVYEIAKVGAGVARSVQIDQMKDAYEKEQAAHDTIARSLGVDRAYDAIYQQSAYNANNINNNGYAPPPHYATVQ